MTAVDFLLDVKLQSSCRRTFAQAIGERGDAPTSVLVEVQAAALKCAITMQDS